MRKQDHNNMDQSNDQHNVSEDENFYQNTNNNSSKLLNSHLSPYGQSSNKVNDLKKLDPSYEYGNAYDQYNTYDRGERNIEKNSELRLSQDGLEMRKTAAFENPPQKNKQNSKYQNSNSNQPIKALANSTYQTDQPQVEVTPEQLSEINRKLKAEMSLLIERLEAAFNKFKDRREKEKQRYGINVYYNGLSSINEEYAQKEKDLKTAQVRAINVKKEIMKIQRKLETAYDIAAITELENDIKNKEALLAKLEDQNNQFKKVGVQQQRAMEDLNKEEELQQKLKAINAQIRQTKMDIKETQNQYMDIDHVVQDQHKKIYDMEERYRKINYVISQKKKVLKAQRETTTTNAEDLSSKDGFIDPDDQLTEEQLELEIKAIEEVRNDGERNVRKLIGELDKKITQLKEESEFNKVRYQEKENEVKICDLKIREIKRDQIAQQAIVKQQQRDEKEKRQKQQQ